MRHFRNTEVKKGENYSYRAVVCNLSYTFTIIWEAFKNPDFQENPPIPIWEMESRHHYLFQQLYCSIIGM